MTKESRLPATTSFEGVFCSGFFIEDPALVTALCLVFDRVHLLNNIEYVVGFAKKYPLRSLPTPPYETRITPATEDTPETSPMDKLTPRQRRVADAYLYRGLVFGVTHHQLFRSGVLNSSMFPENKPIRTWQTPDGMWSASANSMNLTLGSTELDKLLDRGAVPVLGTHLGVSLIDGANGKVRPRHLAALLAMKTVNLALPRTKEAHPETILEARHKLRDYLPPFWNVMFRLSSDIQKKIDEGMPLAELERECEDFVDLHVRRCVYDLKEKLVKERRDWFHKIITQATGGLKVIAGKPPISQQELLVSGIALGANVAATVADHLHTTTTSARATGLTFLLELEKLMQKSLASDD